MSPRSPRTLLSIIAMSAVVFIAGLVLGAGRDSDDTSAINSASKVLLTVGLIALVASVVAEVVRRRRVRSGRAGVRQIP